MGSFTNHVDRICLLSQFNSIITLIMKLVHTLLFLHLSPSEPLPYLHNNFSFYYTRPSLVEKYLFHTSVCMNNIIMKFDGLTYKNISSIIHVNIIRWFV